MMKNKFLLCLLVLVAAVMGCSTKQPPYFKHKLAKQEKLADGCARYNGAFKMESNIVGERYTFQQCLPANYGGAYTAIRSGDTVNIQFAKPAPQQGLYNITLDIDTYPAYHFLTIGETTFAIVPSQN